MESVRLKLKSQKINLEKHQEEIASLDQEVAELLQADAIEKEILSAASLTRRCKKRSY